jgi:hypothetical protein
MVPGIVLPPPDMGGTRGMGGIRACSGMAGAGGIIISDCRDVLAPPSHLNTGCEALLEDRGVR